MNIKYYENKFNALDYNIEFLPDIIVIYPINKTIAIHINIKSRDIMVFNHEYTYTSKFDLRIISLINSILIDCLLDSYKKLFQKVGDN